MEETIEAIVALCKEIEKMRNVLHHQIAASNNLRESLDAFAKAVMKERGNESD